VEEDLVVLTQVEQMVVLQVVQDQVLLKTPEEVEEVEEKILPHSLLVVLVVPVLSSSLILHK
jgi:hypothetical protein